MTVFRAVGVVILRLLRSVALLGVLLALTVPGVFAETSNADLLPLFPERLGSFRRAELPTAADALIQQGVVKSSEAQLGGQATYSGGGNQRLLVEIVRSHQDAEAYSLLSIVAADARSKGSKVELTSDYGTAGFADKDRIVFFKGLDFVRITNLTPSNSYELKPLAKALAETIDKGEADIPALVKHLPMPDQSQKVATFLTRFKGIQTLVPNQTVLSAVETGGDADAAFADLASGKVLIIEYNTPQLAKENDGKIISKIHDLWTLGQPAPIGYRRVGNYSVFVFDAPDDATAKQLIDQVKYEQIVQWLGRNPYIYQEAQKQYVETTLGVFVAVVKASGFAFLGCVGLGGLLGTLLFSRRRAQQRAREAYSDAGGMLRLNIDELTAETDPARLLGPGH